MSKLIDIAKECGAVRINGIGPLAISDDQLRATVEQVAGPLVEALRPLLRYIVTDVVACNGNKCREPYCESCFSDAEESAQEAREKHVLLVNSLAAYTEIMGEKK